MAKRSDGLVLSPAVCGRKRRPSRGTRCERCGGRLGRKIRSKLVERLRNFKSVFGALMMVFGVVIAPVVALAADPVTLPTTGVDMAGTVDALTTGLGAVVLKIVLAFAAYLLIKFGMKWFRRLA